MSFNANIAIPEQREISLHENEVQEIRTMFLLMQAEKTKERPKQLFLLTKRSFDIIGSLLLILLTAWLFPIIALLIILGSKGPVIFKQKRTGLNSKEFYCFKFRSMAVNDDANTMQATENDSRITNIGNILRKTHLDELPQFINILMGDMSFVGPRPHMIYHTQLFSEMIPFYHLRHSSRPGLTGLAQVKGYIGEIQAERDIRKRVHWDVFYINNQSVGMDLDIIVKTLEQVFKRFF